MAYLLEGNPLSLVVGVVLLLVLLSHRTDREQVEHWVKARRAAVERLRRPGSVSLDESMAFSARD